MKGALVLIVVVVVIGIVAVVLKGSPTSPSSQPTKTPDHAVLVHLKLSDDGFGTPEERQAMYTLEDKLYPAINKAGVGEFDGNEFGGGECVLFLYGPNADKLAETVLPIIKASNPRPGSYFIKRYGDAMDENAKEVREDL